ncbi:flavin reductase family protein [Mycolicibacterium parafortuitum]|uniref:Nitrilotriacetate monooxygenase component B [Rhodococcus jostii RHA1] n=1 Tax=Mycolicibacterium parafortuitum TaxID=39692 RepID=A0A375YI33_MYCPF|nr:flavin reductase family protein [Mycolicibacterium parafortuitum]ORB30512.1 monooxygenase [Mycolicibacterium parafortuitum]SRX80768.1 nitrilotriacetate monooxygenase component B [Rhodococcus jostii RHA1] [Mycolicibacterium parafortuitum]
MTTTSELLLPDPATMRAVLGHFCTGVAVITGHDGTRPLGFACQSVTSVSLEPPYVSFCPAATSTSWPLIRATGRLAINVLADDQREVCTQFATSGRDKFGDLAWTPGRNGSPVLDGTVATIEAELEYEHGAGDHTIVVAHVTGLRANRDVKPLLFFQGGYGGFAAADR